MKKTIIAAALSLGTISGVAAAAVAPAMAATAPAATVALSSHVTPAICYHG